MIFEVPFQPTPFYDFMGSKLLLAGQTGGFWNREVAAALRLLGVAAHASSLQKRKLVGRALPGALQSSWVKPGFGWSSWPPLGSLLTQESLGKQQWDQNILRWFPTAALARLALLLRSGH